MLRNYALRFRFGKGFQKTQGKIRRGFRGRFGERQGKIRRRIGGRFGETPWCPGRPIGVTVPGVAGADRSLALALGMS